MARRPSTVLVVDDDPGVCLLCRVNLELDGHRVLEAATADGVRDALAAGQIDVVLLDVHLGPDDGRMLLPSIRRAQPGAAVVVLTGAATSRLDGADAIVRKPFTLSELTAAVSRLSGGRARVG